MHVLFLQNGFEVIAPFFHVLCTLCLCHTYIYIQAHCLWTVLISNKSSRCFLSVQGQPCNFSASSLRVHMNYEHCKIWLKGINEISVSVKNVCLRHICIYSFICFGKLGSWLIIASETQCTPFCWFSALTSQILCSVYNFFLIEIKSV